MGPFESDWVKFETVRRGLGRVRNPMFGLATFELVLLVLIPVILWGCIGVDSFDFGSGILLW